MRENWFLGTMWRRSMTFAPSGTRLKEEGGPSKGRVLGGRVVMREQLKWYDEKPKTRLR